MDCAATPVSIDESGAGEAGQEVAGDVKSYAESFGESRRGESRRRLHGLKGLFGAAFSQGFSTQSLFTGGKPAFG